jgi:uncharacterized membrane protein
MSLDGCRSSPDRWTSPVIRLGIVIILLATLVGTVSATTIESEEEIIRLGEQTEVTIHVNYSELTSQQVSLLIPSGHSPQQLQAHDSQGNELDCEFNDVDSEILCEPASFNTTYNVTVEYTTPNDLSQEEGYLEFNHVQRILIPTERYRLRVVLPEGYGLVEEGNVEPLSPGDARRGSDEGGRQFTVTWEEDGLGLGDVQRYQLKYQELRVFEDIFPDHLSFIAALILILVSLTLYVYVKRRQEEGDTIASIMPVLKDDEQEALRYIIDQGGDCEQKALVDNLDYSKAKVSRLVTDLEERNLIEKVKEGRKNRLILTKEVGNIEAED